MTYQPFTFAMAPTSIPTSSPNQPSSENTSKSENAQGQSTDPATTGHLQWTVQGSNELTDPAVEEILGKTKSKEYVSHGVPIK